ncbi:hypothetical protein WMY93_012759 [Mugilogobius chulae]|uniref:Solute carrier family 13 member 2 n=1 Tax=Mugilogobius chulae TaxID=88201 RepID=A0AAW0NZQ7_9GOBI
MNDATFEITRSLVEARCGYAIILMALYWCTECLPLAVTALLPVVLFPMMNIMEADKVHIEYLKDSNMLFIGGLLVAIAVEHWNLHKRIALRVLLLVGVRPSLLMMGFMIVSSFLSMWISNTATTAMMLPIAHAVLQQLRATEARADEIEERGRAEDNPAFELQETRMNGVVTKKQLDVIQEEERYNESERQTQREARSKEREAKYDLLTKGMSLSVCYSASIGGTATLTGTTPNLILQGQMNQLFPDNGGIINFASWFGFAFPNMILMLIFSYMWLQFMFLGLNLKKSFGCGEKNERDREAYAVMREEYRKLGSMSFAEIMVLEAKAIIAQRSGNPREFFKQKERAMTICVDTSPVSVHRPGRVDSPFLKQQHSPSTPPPHARTHHLSDETENHVNDDDDDDDDVDGDEGTKRSMSTVSPGPKTFSTKEDSADLWDPFPKQEPTPASRDSAPSSKPVQSVAPQPQNSFSVWDSGTDSLVELWDTKPDQSEPECHRAASHCPSLVELTGDAAAAMTAAGAGVGGARPQPLLSFDDVTDGTFCSVNEQEDPPMTLSYQHALQHATNQEPELEDGQLLMTNGNGDSLLKEGTQASEGYFSQSQEEEFGQSEESSAKATPIFYNKPPAAHHLPLFSPFLVPSLLHITQALSQSVHPSIL